VHYHQRRWPCGIAALDMERVFEPYKRLEASRSRETGGVGLGMSIARSIVRGHGGDITLANPSTGELRVTVRVPKYCPINRRTKARRQVSCHTMGRAFSVRCAGASTSYVFIL
jgi:light-regulated signal transduction histidine kinase (bacteriophytochrome)